MTLSSEIIIRKMIPSDMDDILKAYRTIFQPYEPLSTGHEIKTASAQEENYDMSIPRNNICLVARDQRQYLKLVGFLTAFIMTREKMDEFEKFVKDVPKDRRFQSITELINKMNRMVDIFEKYDVEQFFYGAAFAVDPTIRNNSIARELVMESFEWARELKCNIFVTDCTSFYSQKLAESLGGEIIVEIAYKNVVDENGEMIFKPRGVHTHIKRFAKVLDGSKSDPKRNSKL